MVEPFAARLGCEVVWVMGNHDDRGAMRQHLLGEPPSGAPLDRVLLVNGLRIVTLDTSVPGHHHGEVSDAQLAWLARVLDVPAPSGTILAMHHPPLPTVADLAVAVELVDQHRLAGVLAGTDVRAILAGHLHYSRSAPSPAYPFPSPRRPATPRTWRSSRRAPAARTPRRRSAWCRSTRRR